MPPRWRRARPTMANQVLGSITIRVTMPATCSTPTATASNLFSRAGSTPSPNRSMILKSLDQRMRCTKCGNKGADVRPKYPAVIHNNYFRRQEPAHIPRNDCTCHLHNSPQKGLMSESGHPETEGVTVPTPPQLPASRPAHSNKRLPACSYQIWRRCTMIRLFHVSGSGRRPCKGSTS
jgi:hypothetical protein